MDPDREGADCELVSFGGDRAPDAPRVTARAARGDGGLWLDFTLADGAPRVRLPPPATPRRRDRLWEHTCFEAFVACAGRTAYWELNLAPGGDWNLYRFAGYRDGMATEDRIGALDACAATPLPGGGLVLRAGLPLAALPELGAALELGLAAVLEDVDGARSFWALRHPGDRPDFHRRDGFVLRLPPEETR